MKKKPYNYLVLLFTVILFNFNNAIGQSSSTGTATGTPNQPLVAGTDYLGWDNTVAVPLDIRHDAGYPIYWWTNSVARMQIYDDPSVPFNAGYVGIGEFFTSGFIPQNMLHQHINDTLDTYHQFTNSNTGGGVSPVEGFKVGIHYESFGTPIDVVYPPRPYSIAELRQVHNSPMQFFTNDSVRMNITTQTIGGIPRTRVGINRFNGVTPNALAVQPLSVLQLGENYWGTPSGPAGYRQWMDVGTFCDFSSDFCYFGTMHETGDTSILTLLDDHADGVIAWGDNIHTPDGADNLRIIFSSPISRPGSATSGLYSSLEVARFTPFGRMGIGNFSINNFGRGSGFQPVRKLEIYDEHNDSLLNAAEPQLRLTYNWATTNVLTTGRWTDFQSTQRGDLYIHPFDDSTAADRYVGINQPLPNNTLELESELTTNVGAPNSGARLMAGLRFTRLTSATSPAENIPPHGRVLTVDSAGEVGLTEDIGSVAPLGFCNPGPLPLLAGHVGLQLQDLAGGPAFNISYTGQDEYVNSNPGIGGGTPPFNSTVVNSAIGLGFQACTQFPAKFSVLQESTPEVAVPTIAGYFRNHDNSINSPLTFERRALYAITDGRLPSSNIAATNIGGDFEARNCWGGNIALRATVDLRGDSANRAIGIQVTVNGTGVTRGTTPRTFGIFANSFNGARENYGIRTQALAGPNTILNYGIYSFAPSGGPFNGARAAGFFNGWLYSTRNFFPSDSILKDSIQPLINAMDVINALSAKTYVFRTSSYPTMNLDSGRFAGFLAENVESTAGLDVLVKGFAQPQPIDTLGNADTTVAVIDFKAIDYTGLIPYTVAGLQELSLTIDSLRGTTFGLCDEIPSLPSDAGIDLNTHNLYFKGQAAPPETMTGKSGNGPSVNSVAGVAGGAVGIGYNCGEELPGKLSVNEASGEVDHETIAGYFHNGDIVHEMSLKGVQIDVDGSALGTEEGIGNVFGLSIEVNPMASNSVGIWNHVGGIQSFTIGQHIVVNPNLVPDENGRETSRGLQVLNYPTYTGPPTSAHAIGALIQSIGFQTEEDNGSNYGLTSEAVTGNFVTGVYATASNGSKTNIGVNAYSDGGGSDMNYGLYASAAIGSCGSSGCTDAAIFCEGDLALTGTPYLVSDEKLKENVKPLENAMSILNQLHPKSYTFKTNDYPTVSLPKTEQNGLIAQEVEQVLPNLVKNFKVLPPIDSATHEYDPSAVVDVKAINYTGLIPYLIQGIKEQQQTIDEQKQYLDSLRSQLNALQSAVNSCCNGGRTSSPPDTSIQNGIKLNTHAIDVTLSNEASIVLALDQNFPNPFAEKTTINFSIPDNVIAATIMFYDNLGRVLQTVTINQRGAGQLNVFAGNLSTGIYSYSLIADGKVIDTKKMVCDK